jgi:hypothetical protein
MFRWQDRPERLRVRHDEPSFSLSLSDTEPSPGTDPCLRTSLSPSPDSGPGESPSLNSHAGPSPLEPTARPRRPAATRPLPRAWAWVWPATMVGLVAATSLTVAVFASEWLVPPYLVLMGLILGVPKGLRLPTSLSKGLRARLTTRKGRWADSTDLANPSSKDGLASGFERSQTLDDEHGSDPEALAHAAEAAGDAFEGEPNGSSGSSPTEPGSELSAVKSRRGKGRGRKGKAVPQSESAGATWVRVGPGKFVRIDASSAAPPADTTTEMSADADADADAEASREAAPGADNAGCPQQDAAGELDHGDVTPSLDDGELVVNAVADADADEQDHDSAETDATADVAAWFGRGKWEEEALEDVRGPGVGLAGANANGYQAGVGGDGHGQGPLPDAPGVVAGVGATSVAEGDNGIAPDAPDAEAVADHPFASAGGGPVEVPWVVDVSPVFPVEDPTVFAAATDPGLCDIPGAEAVPDAPGFEPVVVARPVERPVADAGTGQPFSGFDPAPAVVASSTAFVPEPGPGGVTSDGPGGRREPVVTVSAVAASRAPGPGSRCSSAVRRGRLGRRGVLRGPSRAVAVPRAPVALAPRWNARSGRSARVFPGFRPSPAAPARRFARRVGRSHHDDPDRTHPPRSPPAGSAPSGPALDGRPPRGGAR